MMTTSRQQILRDTLAQLAESQAISLALLANEDGLLFEVVPETDLAGTLAAVGAALNPLALRTTKGGQADEATIRYPDGRRSVFRYFSCGQRDLLLGVVVEPKRAYRRLTNRALREICSAWPDG